MSKVSSGRYMNNINMETSCVCSHVVYRTSCSIQVCCIAARILSCTKWKTTRNEEIYILGTEDGVGGGGGVYIRTWRIWSQVFKNRVCTASRGKVIPFGLDGHLVLLYSAMSCHVRHKISVNLKRKKNNIVKTIILILVGEMRVPRTSIWTKLTSTKRFITARRVRSESHVWVQFE